LYSKNADEIKDIKKDVKDMVKPICEISGSWLKNITIGGKKYWDIENDIPTR